MMKIGCHPVNSLRAAKPLCHLISKSSRKANLARSMAATYGLKKGKILQRAEMESLVRQLFQCESSLYAPSGKKVYVRYDEGDLSKLFKSPH